MTNQVGIRGWVKEELDEELSMGLKEKHSYLRRRLLAE